MNLRFDLGHLFASLPRFPRGDSGLFLSRLFSQAPLAPFCLDVGPHKPPTVTQPVHLHVAAPLCGRDYFNFIWLLECLSRSTWRVQNRLGF